MLKVGKLTLLQQNNTRKPIIQIPEIHTTHAPLIIQLTIHIKRIIGLDLHLAHPLAGDSTLSRSLAAACANAARTALIQWRVELVGPWRAVRVAVAVVVAQEIVAACLLAALDGQGLVDGREKVFGQVGGEGDDGVEVVGCVFGVEAAEEVPGGLVKRKKEGLRDVQCRVEGVF